MVYFLCFFMCPKKRNFVLLSFYILPNWISLRISGNVLRPISTTTMIYYIIMVFFLVTNENCPTKAHGPYYLLYF